MTPQELSVRNKQELKGEEQTRAGRTYQPDVDICETQDSLWLWADMPGVDEGSIEVKVADGVLSIEGRVSLQDYENLAPVYTEYNVGNYLRRFAVSSDIDADHIKASMASGVLKVELPKAESAKPRRIPVSLHCPPHSAGAAPHPRTLRECGRVSYCMYIIHMAVPRIEVCTSCPWPVRSRTKRAVTMDWAAKVPVV